VNKENLMILRILNTVSDAVLVVLAMLLAYLFRFLVLNGQETMPFLFYVRSGILISLLYLLLFAAVGLYDSLRNAQLMQVTRKIGFLSLICCAVLSTYYFVISSVHVSRWLLVFFYLFSTAALAGKRLLLYRILYSMRMQGRNLKPVILVGSGDCAREYLNALRDMPWLGYQVLGNVGSKPVSADVPYLGTISVLDSLLRNTEAEDIVAAPDLDEFSEMPAIMALSDKHGLKFSLIPYFAPYIPAQPQIDQIGSLPLINLRRVPLDNIVNGLVKRLFDIVGSLLLIVLTSPLMLLGAVGTLLTLGRPILFRQVRIGHQRKPFTMLKFRSMRQPKPEDASGWSQFDRDRLTRFGAFLRKTSIDELPQLFNVLSGSMSLVGPRPELPKYVDQFRETVPLYMLKHQVRPGITGLAQVKGYRGDTSIEERIRLDIRYIENWSLLMDLKILFLTLFHFMDNGEKAHVESECKKSSSR